MATKATTPTRGRAAGEILWHIPSRREVTLSLFVDLALAAVGVPLWVHLALAGLLHLGFRVCDQIR